MSRILLLLLACGMSLTTLLVAADRPNFVWLISEDNSIHYLKMFYEHGAETPHIAALAKEGLIFDHAFSNSPVCSVARTTLITGCYGPRIGTQYHRRAAMAPMPAGLRMFPAYLREAGYYASNRRKKDYNAVEGEGVWDESSESASWRKRSEGQPFFHMQSFATTHESSLHFTAETMQDEATETDPDKVVLAPYHPDTPTFRYTYARYHDRIQQVDRQIGEVVAQLDADQLLEDTFVFYFGDHGGVLPRGKGYAYESGLHVPLVVRVPEKWRHLVDRSLDTRVSGFVSFIDFGPTLLNLAGLEIPEQVDGRPFLGEGVTKSTVDARDEAFGYADRFDEKYDLVRTVRVGKYTYVRSYQPFNFDGLQNNYRYRMLAYSEWRQLFQAGRLDAVQSQFFEPRPAEMLFDVESDPHETNNLATNPDYAEVTRKLCGRLTEWVTGMPDLSFHPESYFVENGIANPVEFGQRYRDEIGQLVETANLSLLDLADARSGIESALQARDPWQRYWGLIACSSFGKAALPFADQARRMAAEDPERLVRVRAAELLGLIEAADPRPIIVAALAETESGVEANLILNTLVLLRDGAPGYDFKLKKADLKKLRPDPTGYVDRRFEYLDE